MKRFVSFVICLCMFLSCMTATAFAVEGEDVSSGDVAEDVNGITGDADQNGKITAADARTVLRVAAKLQTISDGVKALLDVNDDGSVNASDARLILRVAAKLDCFPAEYECYTTGHTFNTDGLCVCCGLNKSDIFNVTGLFNTAYSAYSAASAERQSDFEAKDNRVYMSAVLSVYADGALFEETISACAVIPAFYDFKTVLSKVQTEYNAMLYDVERSDTGRIVVNDENAKLFNDFEKAAAEYISSAKEMLDFINENMKDI